MFIEYLKNPLLISTPHQSQLLDSWTRVASEDVSKKLRAAWTFGGPVHDLVGPMMQDAPPTAVDIWYGQNRVHASVVCLEIVLTGRLIFFTTWCLDKLRQIQIFFSPSKTIII